MQTRLIKDEEGIPSDLSLPDAFTTKTENNFSSKDLDNFIMTEKRMDRIRRFGSYKVRSFSMNDMICTPATDTYRTTGM